MSGAMRDMTPDEMRAELWRVHQALREYREALEAIAAGGTFREDDGTETPACGVCGTRAPDCDDIDGSDGSDVCPGRTARRSLASPREPERAGESAGTLPIHPPAETEGPTPAEWPTVDVLAYVAIALGDLSRLTPDAAYGQELRTVATEVQERTWKLREGTLAGPCDQCNDIVAWINRPTRGKT